MTTISGSVAVVTGGASGIGKGIAESLRERGAEVIIADIDGTRARQVADELGCRAEQVDVASLQSVENLASSVLSELGRVDIVVNNAGVGPFAPISKLSMEDWRWILDVNLFGVIHGVNVFLPILERNPHGGHIVNTSSMAALTPFETLGSYAVAKSGVAILTEVLEAELRAGDSDVRTSLLIPGSVKTGISSSTRHRQGGGALEDREIGLDFASSTHWLEPKEVGEMVAKAIQENHALVITHPERLPAVEARFDRICQAFKHAADEVRGAP